MESLTEDVDDDIPTYLYERIFLQSPVCQGLYEKVTGKLAAGHKQYS